MAPQQSKPREWKLWREDFESEQHFLDAVAEEAMRCVWIGHRLGRGVVNAPIRQRHELDPDEFLTVGWVFRDIFIPAARAEQPEPAAEDIPDLSTVEAEPQAA